MCHVFFMAASWLLLLCLACNSVLSIWQGQPRSKPPPLRAYCAPSVSNSIGPACGILALRYISFPAQVVY